MYEVSDDLNLADNMRLEHSYGLKDLDNEIGICRICRICAQKIMSAPSRLTHCSIFPPRLPAAFYAVTGRT